VETPARERRVRDGDIAGLPAALDIEHARLPATYQAMKYALAECVRIDECQHWANKAEALASYARQANDDELRKMADRIQARALRRADELLQKIPEARGGDQSKNAGTVIFGRTKAAQDAGLSERQRVTAHRIGNIPEPEFENAIESDDPPTVTALAERGKQTRLDHLGGRDPEDYHQGTLLQGVIRRWNRDVSNIDLPAAVRGLWPDELVELLSEAEKARELLANINLVIGA
jgi:hypothetical protein